MTEIQINLLPDGNMEMLDTDLLPLHEFGRLNKRRASNVEFNNKTQRWEVVVCSTGEKLTGDWKQRKPALAKEIEVLNARMTSNPGRGV